MGSQLRYFPGLFAAGAGGNSLVQFIPYWSWGQPRKLRSASLPAESHSTVELNLDIATPRVVPANLQGELLPESQR